MWKRWSFKERRESTPAVESGLPASQLVPTNETTTLATKPGPNNDTRDIAAVEVETTAGAGNVTPPVVDGNAISEPSVPVSPPTAPSIPTQQSNDVVVTKSVTEMNNTSEGVDPPSNSGAQQMNTLRHRISFRSLAFFYGRDKQTTIPSSPSSISVNKNDTQPGKITRQKLSRSEKESRSAAIALRTLIMGPSSLPPPPRRSTNNKVFAKVTNMPSPSDIKKVKEQLMKPRSANDIVRQLRQLPLPDGPSFRPSGHPSTESLVTHPDKGGNPIHAVCLPCTDEQAEKLHFSRLRSSHSLVDKTSLSPTAPSPSPAQSEEQANISTASLESLVSVLQGLQPVSILESPDLGFGQPVSESTSGPLAGSVPSPMTIMEGFEDITRQLMALGFATSKTIYPSHEGVHPPEDRLSVLTYWWGLELVLPEPSVKYLAKVKSISGTLLNLLSALSMFNEGAREILPFVRYIANFVDFEWSAIQAQDKGKGVVCAATWIMPAALVPRPWDFDPHPSTSGANQNTTNDGAKSPPPKEKPPFLPNPHALEPVSPVLPMMPQLMVTPATLPRNSETPSSLNPS